MVSHQRICPTDLIAHKPKMEKDRSVTFANFKNYIRAEWVMVAFIALVVAVTAVRFSVRNDHFQESDSSLSYQVLNTFPAAGIAFTSDMSSGAFISENAARRIMAWPLTKKLMDFYRRQHHVTDEVAFQDRVLHALTRLNPISAFRVTYMVAVSQAPLPSFVKSFFALPSATTYSPGVGVLFGMLGGGGIPYDQFMSDALGFTVLLFAASAMLFFLICRRLGADPLVGALAATMFFFSLSPSSYSYHLGNTISNIASGFVWFMVFVMYWGKPSFLKKISLATGIIVFFDYLIVFYWLACVAAVFWMEHKPAPGAAAREAFRNFFALLKTQRFAIACFVIVGLFFYPPGQSYRAQAMPINLVANTYHIVLNFFGFYNRSGLNILQFGIATALLLVGLFFAFTKRFEPSSPWSGAYRCIAALLAICLVAFILRILAFYPGRHILAFTPAAFTLIALALGDIVKRFRIPPILVCSVWFLVVILGMLSLSPAIARSKRISSIGPVGKDIAKVYIGSWSAPSEYIHWGVDVPVESIKPATFAPEANKTYLYISNDVPFQEDMERLAQKRPYQKSQPVFEVLSERHYGTGACFTGFPVNRCSYGEPNQMYKTEFRLIRPGQ